MMSRRSLFRMFAALPVVPHLPIPAAQTVPAALPVARNICTRTPMFDEISAATLACLRKEVIVDNFFCENAFLRRMTKYEG